jgi:trehalose 6-phosphate phosphatase
LVPFAAAPSLAVVDLPLRAMLTKLGQQANNAVGVISARGLNQLTVDFGNEIILAGNYGMEIRYPDGSCEIQPQAQQAQPEITAAYNGLQKSIGNIPGIIVENHGLTLCVHKHLVKDTEMVKSIEGTCKQLPKQYEFLKVRTLTTSYEVLPQFVWDKSYALSCIQKHLFGEDFEHLYLFAGDSEYDEPGFNWINQHDGISIRVGSDAAPTVAKFVLDTPEFLQQLIRELAA